VNCEFCTSDDIQNPKKVHKIAKQLLVKMNVKLGGEPWRLVLPETESFQDLLLIGINMMSVTKVPPNSSTKGTINSCSVGAAVASMNSDLTHYYGTMFKYDKKGEIGNLIKIQIQSKLNYINIWASDNLCQGE
jgi:hypothetical protein